MTDKKVDEKTTRATARFPGLEIDIVHHQPPSGEFEQISINLRATPSFDEFGQFLGSANPFLIWAQAAQMAWLPWLGLARAFTPQMLDPPARRQHGSDEPESERRIDHGCHSACKVWTSFESLGRSPSRTTFRRKRGLIARRHLKKPGRLCAIAHRSGLHHSFAIDHKTKHNPIRC